LWHKLQTNLTELTRLFLPRFHNCYATFFKVFRFIYFNIKDRKKAKCQFGISSGPVKMRNKMFNLVFLGKLLPGQIIGPPRGKEKPSGY